jgi:hypothetical protein
MRRVHLCCWLAAHSLAFQLGSSLSQSWLEACEIPTTQLGVDDWLSTGTGGSGDGGDGCSGGGGDGGGDGSGGGGRGGGGGGGSGGGSVHTAAAGQGGVGAWSGLLEGLQVVVQSLEDASAVEREVLLHELAPQYIVLYDTDLESIRQIEVHQTRPFSSWSTNAPEAKRRFGLRRVYMLTCVRAELVGPLWCIWRFWRW